MNYDFATDTRGDAIFEHPAGGCHIDHHGRRTMRSTASATRTIGRASIGSIPSCAGIQAVIDRALPGKVNLMLNRPRDGNRILIWSSAADDPGTYYVYDRAARRMRGLRRAVSAAAGPTASRRYGRSASAPRRHRDPGYLTLPPGRPERDLPLIADAAWRPLRARQLGASTLGPVSREPRLCRAPGQFPRLDRLRPRLCRARLWPARQRHDRRSRGRRRLARPSRALSIARARLHHGCLLWWLCGALGADPPSRPLSLRDQLRRRHRPARDAPLRSTRCSPPRAITANGSAGCEGEGDADLDAVSPFRQAARITRAGADRAWRARSHRAASRSPAIWSARWPVAATGVESVFYPEAVHGFTRPQDSADFLRRVEAFLARHNPADAAPAPAPAAAPR